MTNNNRDSPFLDSPYFNNPKCFFTQQSYYKKVKCGKI